MNRTFQDKVADATGVAFAASVTLALLIWMVISAIVVTKLLQVLGATEVH